MGDFILQISIHVLLVTALHRKFHLGCDFHHRFHYMCNLHCKSHFRSLYMDFMPRSQISFQLATPLLDFILFWLLIPSWMNLFHCGFHFSCYFPHTYHFSYSLHCRFHFSLYFHWGFHLISHFHVHHDYISEDTSIFPTHPYQKI